MRYSIYFIVFTSMFSVKTYAQGCSDAGFCTIDSFKAHNEDTTTTSSSNQIKSGVFYGSADNSITVYGSYLEFNKTVNEKLGLDVKLTSLGQNGNNISVFGLSDLFVNSNIVLSKNVKFTIGIKAPLNEANRLHNGLNLPMDYQSSLGTFDLILGSGFKLRKLQIVAAIQQPLTQNKNAFISNSYPEDSRLRFIQTTNRFKRSGDVLLRVSYPFSLGEKLSLTPSILPIYHISNDRYLDLNNIEQEIVGSQGLTLNANIYVDYKINSKNIIQLNAGSPFIVRSARPDGLTRSFIVNLEYRIKF